MKSRFQVFSLRTGLAHFYLTDLYRPITSIKYRGGGKFRKKETVVIRSDEGLTRETSALKLLTYLIRYRLYSDPNPIS